MFAPFALVSVLFTFSRFSFGYVLGFYFYTMILGYLWLVPFSKFHYDHSLASASSFMSALMFLIPALFITHPIKQLFALSTRALDHLLSVSLIVAAAIVAIGSLYNFRMVHIVNIYEFRDALVFPTSLNYAMGVTENALLPFAFACFVTRGNHWRAVAVLLLLLLFYPITLTKAALFSPFWLVFLALLSRLFESRTSVVLSLFIPITIGLVLILLLDMEILSLQRVIYYLGIVNFRMFALPSSALDFYNDFFSNHELTYFCQISFLKPLVNCPYSDPLSIVMNKAYHIGNFNASLFATEGIASVGLTLAPFSALGCALVIAFANRVSSGLPSNFVMLSGGILPQVFLNVPFTITLLTNGASVLFLLWYIMPRAMFKETLPNSASLIPNGPETSLAA